MKIKKVLAATGYGGFFWDDQAAIKTGLKRNGFIYEGDPITPGFEAVRIPSEAICVIFILEDGQVAYGDCVSVQYSGISGRDPILKSNVYIPFFRSHIAPVLEGKEVKRFKEFVEEFDSTMINGKNIHSAIKYGVTQAILDSVAKAKKKTMAEVICEEYGLRLPENTIPVFIQTGDDLFESVDKAILRRVEAFPHYSINNLEKMGQLPELLGFIKNRIQSLADESYSPYLHYDLYGMLGLKYGRKINQIVDQLRYWAALVSPYRLTIEAPFIMDTQEETIELTRELIEKKKEEGLEIIICVDEWFNTFDGIKKAISSKAAEMVQIKAPAMGGLNQIIEALDFCKKSGVKAYLGGSCCETERSAQITTHIALATRPFQMLAKPGMGVDEGYQIVMNEMSRALSIIKNR